MEFLRGKQGMSLFFVAGVLEIKSFEYPLVAKRSRISPKPLPNIYINMECLEYVEEQSFFFWFSVMSSYVFFLNFSSLIFLLRAPREDHSLVFLMLVC